MTESKRAGTDLTPNQFYDLHYSESGLDRELIVELLEHLSRELRVPVGAISPKDRFAVELRPKRGAWDSGYGVLLFELKRLASSKGVQLEQPIATVDDYLRAMAKVY